MASALSIDVFNSGYKPIPGGPGWDDSIPATWPACTSTLISQGRRFLVNTTDQQPGQTGVKPTIVLVHGGTAIEFAINPALLQEAFAADLPAETTAVMAATQRPVAAAAFSDASGPPAWRRLPSWAVVATGDKAAGADVVRSQAQRAGADIVEVEGSHVIMISQPQAVTDHILKAARAVADAHR